MDYKSVLGNFFETRYLSFLNSILGNGHRGRYTTFGSTNGTILIQGLQQQFQQHEQRFIILEKASRPSTPVLQPQPIRSNVGQEIRPKAHKTQRNYKNILDTSGRFYVNPSCFLCIMDESIPIL